MNASISVEKWVVDSIVGILVSSGAVDYWGSNLVVYLWKSISVVSVSVNSSIIEVLGFSFSITLSKMMNASISVEKWVVDSILVNYWGSNLVVYLWKSISVVSI